MYQPIQVSKCEKCGKVIAELKEQIRIRKTTKLEYKVLSKMLPRLFSDYFF